MPSVHIAIAGVGKTATHIVGTILSNPDMLKEDVEIYLLDTKEPKHGEPERRKAELLAKEFRDSGRALGREYRVYSGPDNVPNPDITIITTGRQRLPGETRSKMSKDNSIPIKKFITEYCPNHNISLKNSKIGNLVNGVGCLSPYVLERMEEAYGKEANPNNIFSFGAGLDWMRTEGTICDFIDNDPDLKGKYSRYDIAFKGVCGGHDDTMVHAMDCSTVGGEPIKEVLGGENVNQICNEVRKMGALYNEHLEGAGPSVGADVLLDLVIPVVNNSLENVPILAPLRIDRDLSGLGLSKDNVHGHLYKMAENSKIIKPKDVEDLPFKYVWTGLCPKIGSEGMTELGIPELSDKEKDQMEYSIASAIMENMEGGLLNRLPDYRVKRPAIAAA
ncbi:MAG: hypothetical protein WA139_03260 [Candidatus Aenigmatarchaeota archaeon]